MSSAKKPRPKKSKSGPKRKKKVSPDTNGTSIHLGNIEKAVDRLREENINLKKLDYLERTRSLLPREMIFECLSRLSKILKNTGEILQKDHGDDARKILEEGLQEYEKSLTEIIDEAD